MRYEDLPEGSYVYLPQCPECESENIVAIQQVQVNVDRCLKQGERRLMYLEDEEDRENKLMIDDYLECRGCGYGSPNIERFDVVEGSVKPLEEYEKEV